MQQQPQPPQLPQVQQVPIQQQQQLLLLLLLLLLLPLLGVRLPLLPRRIPAIRDVPLGADRVHRGGGRPEDHLHQDRQPEAGGAHRRRRQRKQLPHFQIAELRRTN